MKRHKMVTKKDTRPRIANLKKMNCDNFAKCGETVMVDQDCVSVLGPKCVSSRVGCDPKLLQQTKKVVKKADGFPRGWHLYKQFVHPDGRVFEYGKENVELKGTLPVTQVKVNTLTRTQRRRLREEKQEKRDARAAKRYAKKMKKLKKEEERAAE